MTTKKSDAPQSYVTVPVLIEAWQITHDNIHEVAKWCKGRVKGESITFPKIRDRTKQLAGNDNNHYGRIGQYVVRRAKGFDLQTREAFENGHRSAGTRAPKEEKNNSEGSSK